MDHPVYCALFSSANIGGLLGLCMGFSLLTAIEIVYWFLVRWGILRLKRKAEKRGNKNRVQVGPDMSKEYVDLQSAAFRSVPRFCQNIFLTVPQDCGLIVQLLCCQTRTKIARGTSKKHTGPFGLT